MDPVEKRLAKLYRNIEQLEERVSAQEEKLNESRAKLEDARRELAETLRDDIYGIVQDAGLSRQDLLEIIAAQKTDHGKEENLEPDMENETAPEASEDAENAGGREEVDAGDASGVDSDRVVMSGGAGPPGDIAENNHTDSPDTDKEDSDENEPVESIRI